MKKTRKIWSGVLMVTVAVGVLSIQLLETPKEKSFVPLNSSQVTSSSQKGVNSETEKMHIRDSDSNLNDSITSLHNKLATIHHQLTTLTAEQASMRHELDGLYRTESLPDIGTEFVSVSHEQIETGLQKQQAFFEKRLGEEEIDTEWAKKTIAVLDESFQHEELSGINLVDATCGSSLCQLDLAFDEDIPIEDGMQRLSVHRPWDGPTFVSVTEGHQPKIFFARDGHELPKVPEEPDVQF